MIQNCLTLLFCLLLALACAASISAQDIGVADTIAVDSAIAHVNGIGIVPIRLANDNVITALEITLQESSSWITVDSFSFDGGRLDIEGAINGYDIIANNSVISLFSFMFSTALPAGSGVIGNIYYSYPQNTPLQVIPIDTVSWSVGQTTHSTWLRGADSPPETYIPQFKRGYLDIQATPETADSVWVDNIEAEPNQAVAVGVHGFNERDLSKIALALQYGSDLLRFDSLSWTGTRVEYASNKTVQPSGSAHTVYAVAEAGQLAPLSPGSGLLATLHFTVDAACPETTFVIDSVMVGLNSGTEFTITNALGGGAFTPGFTPGSIEVKIVSGVEDITPENTLPTDFALAQNYPNPFNPTTSIELSLPTASKVTLDVFNIIGQKVRNLIDAELPAGVHRVEFDGRASSGNTLATGVYFYRISIDEFTQTKKMLLMK